MMSPNYKNFSFAIFCTVFLFCNINTFAQVGIGTTEPETMLHVVGEYVPPVTGVNTLLDENFQGLPIGRYEPQLGNLWPDCPSNGWEVKNTSTYRCTDCSDQMLYINSSTYRCSMNNTAIVKIPIIPSSTEITVSFGYRLKGSQYGSDLLNLILHNETDGSSRIMLRVENSPSIPDVNTTYNGTWPITSGDEYSLRFQYVGTFRKGATVDNIKVTEQTIGVPGKYAFKLEDGTQGSGYVLTSDRNGNATWQPLSPRRPVGSEVSGTFENAGSLEAVPAGRRENPENQQLLNDLKNTIRERETTLETERAKIDAMEAKIRELE